MPNLEMLVFSRLGPVTNNRITTLEVLLLENDFLVGIFLKKLLTDLRLEPIGPARSLEEASWLVGTHPELRAAVLDMDTSQDNVWPLARELRDRGVPFLFIAELGAT